MTTKEKPTIIPPDHKSYIIGKLENLISEMKADSLSEWFVEEAKNISRLIENNL